MNALFEPRLRRNIDRILLFAVFCLMMFSLVAIYGAKGSMAGMVRQGAYFLLGIGLMVWVASRDYANVPRFVPLLYGINILLLIIVEFFAPEVNGAQRWIPLPIPGMDFKLQPSEFAKVITILTLSSYVHRLGAKIQEFPTLLKTLAHIGLPTILIMKQPDLGTALVIVAIWTGIVFLAGAKWQHLVGLAVVGALLFGAAVKFHILHEYQIQRLRQLFNPESDKKGKGWQVTQSLTAIGGGGVTGQGIRKGLQTNGRFIPENNTDFIFTVVGEETGFVGSCLLLTIYSVILYRGLVISATSEDPLGRLIAGGVVTLLAFHLTINIGMTCGILPVVGVPLPLMSFGGSAAWVNLTGIGLLLSIYMRRHKLSF